MSVEPSPRVAIDEVKLGQVLVNLLLNAAQAIAPGASTANEIAIGVRPGVDGRVVIEVSDTGPGMAPAVSSRVFEPFFTTKPVGIGTGLGLAICHGIVSSCGGEIQVESIVGKGSVFRVILPASMAGTATAAEPTPGGPVRSAVERFGRLLVIDDEVTIRSLVARMLPGHTVVPAATAIEALQLIERGERFDVIFSDLMMPEMTGMKFYETMLREHPRDAKRIVFLTGGAATARAHDFLSAVSNRRLDKPFHVEQLRATVQEMLGRNSRSQ